MKRLFLLTACALLMFQAHAFAFWIWTPETNRWTNPKYDVKDDPEEQLTFAKGFSAAKDYKKAVQEFEKLIRHYPKSREAAEAQYLIGRCYEDQIRPYEAFKSYQKVVDKYPFSDRFTEIVERQFKIGERLLNGEGKSGKFVSTLLGSDYDVIETFRTVIKNAPYGQYAAPAQYQIGLYLSEKGLFQEARDEFEKVVNDYPNSDWVKAAKYQIALVDAKRSTEAQYDQKVTKTAVEEFKEFVKIYPDAELSEKAQAQINDLREKEAENHFLIAKYYEKTKKYKAAKLYYETVMKDYQNTSWAAKASERLRALASKDQTKS